MDKIMDSLFVFRGEGIIENFPGNYSDFRAYEDSKPREEKKSIAAPKKEVAKKTSNPKGKLNFNENREFGLLETDIAKLEKNKIRIESQFANSEIPTEEINKKSQELQQIISNLEQKEERWFELSMKLEG